jgi:membrane protein
MKKTGMPDILQVGATKTTGARGQVLMAVRSVYAIASSFISHQGPLRAAALTYTTVLSLVPFLAIAFSVLKGLGAQNSLEPLLQQVAGDSEETISRLIDYVNNTNVKSMGAIGLVMLIVTVVSLMGSIEEAFNSIWGVRETRSIQRRFSDYLSVVIVGPILLLAATSMTSTLQSQWLLQWLINNTYLGDAILLMFRFLPYVTIWIAMVFLYLFIPNTKVRFTSALTGGIVAGTAWELAQWGYFHFQVGVANYNAIYGTLAAVPVFLVWIYTSWLIVLFGLEIVVAHQHRGHVFSADGTRPLSVAAREEVALAVLVQAALQFRNGAALTSRLLSDELAVPLALLEPVIADLQEFGYLAATVGNEPTWLPGRDPGGLPVSELFASLRGDVVPPDAGAVMQAAGAAVQQGWQASRDGLRGVTIADLLPKTVAESSAE